MQIKCTLGGRGTAFDGPEVRRAYTYDHQPDNIVAYRLGDAWGRTASAKVGDHIDRGLALLKELQALGLGVYSLNEADMKGRDQ